MAASRSLNPRHAPGRSSGLARRGRGPTSPDGPLASLVTRPRGSTTEFKQSFAISANRIQTEFAARTVIPISAFEIYDHDFQGHCRAAKATTTQQMFSY